MKKSGLVFLGLIFLVANAFSLDITNIRAKQDNDTPMVSISYDLVGEEIPGTELTIDVYAIIDGNEVGPLQQVEFDYKALVPGRGRIVKWNPQGEIPPLADKGKTYFKLVLREWKEYTAVEAIPLAVPEAENQFVIDYNNLRLIVLGLEKTGDTSFDLHVRIENKTNQEQIYNQGNFAYQLNFTERQLVQSSRVIIDPDQRQQPHLFRVPGNGIVIGVIRFFDPYNSLRGYTVNIGDLVRFQATVNQQQGVIENIPVE